MVKAKRRRLLEPNSTKDSLRPQTEMEKLSYWIRNFVFSFESGKLRSVLEAARFLRRNSGAWQVNPFKIISGLAVVINCDSWKDYKLLATKNKQLAYRIRKIDPEVDLFMLLSPDETIVELTVIATFERFTIERFLKAMSADQPQIRTYTHPHRFVSGKQSPFVKQGKHIKG